MKQTITIVCSDMFMVEAESHQIEADVVDGFAVHKKWTEDSRDGKSEYRVTHIKSGIAFGRAKSEKEAKRMRSAMKSIEIGGVLLADMPTCEILAAVLVIKAAIAARIEKDGIDDDEMIERAGKYADLFACGR